MPQLNKGGKFVFGLSVIRSDLTIHIPPQALLEYDTTRDGKVIIFTGSKITGGFCVATYSLLSNSKLKHILEDCPALRDCLLYLAWRFLSIYSRCILFVIKSKVSCSGGFHASFDWNFCCWCRTYFWIF